MSDTPQVKIAILQEQMKNIEKKVDDGFMQINHRLDNFSTTIASFSQATAQQYATREQVAEVKRIATSRLYLSILGSTITTAVVTALIYYFVSHQVG